MRRFELTIGVYVPDDETLPETFEEWMARAGFFTEFATPTTLERVVETRYPLSADVVAKRAEKGVWRS